MERYCSDLTENIKSEDRSFYCLLTHLQRYCLFITGAVLKLINRMICPSSNVVSSSILQVAVK